MVTCVITKTKRYEHIQSVLSELHLLLVTQHINFKVAMLTFKIRKLIKPAYLATLFCDKGKTRSVRSSNKCNLEIPRWWTWTVKQSFSYVGLSIWNSLPDSIRQLVLATVSLSTFGKQLKPYCFHSACLLDSPHKRISNATYGK